MKILLMVPPVKMTLTTEISNEVSQNMGNFPPLGILYIGTYIKKYSDHEVIIIDPESRNLGYNEIGDIFKLHRPDVIGITTFTNSLCDVVQVVKLAKTLLPDTVICLGGPHVHLYPEESLHREEVDYAIIGDGEIAFLKLLNVIGSNYSSPEERYRDLKNIEGIVFRDYSNGGRIYKNSFARVNDLDSLPMPDRSFLDNALYYCILGKDRKFTTIMSSRGCPFQCTFCNAPDKLYRYRSPINVVDEMEDIVRFGIEEIFFFDDLFNIKPERVIEICDEIIKRKIDVHWAFRGRVNGITDELVRKVKAAGCERIQFGIEKGTDKGLKAVKKGTTIEEIRRAVYITKKYGLTAVGNFLIGTPGETKEDIMQIIDFALELKLDHAEFNTFIPYPGSRIYDDAVKSGFYKKDYWREFSTNPDPGFRITWDEILSEGELNRLNAYAAKRFYLRPRIIINELKAISTVGEFMRKIKGAFIVLGLK